MRKTILGFGFYIIATVVAFGQPAQRLAPDLPDRGGEKVDVIIQFNDPPGQSDYQLGQRRRAEAQAAGD